MFNNTVERGGRRRGGRGGDRGVDGKGHGGWTGCGQGGKYCRTGEWRGRRRGDMKYICRAV